MEVSQDKEIIIPNVMKELCEKHDEAIKNNQTTEFDVMTFYHIGAYLHDPSLKEGISKDQTVIKTLEEYATKTQFITVRDRMVSLTQNGIKESKEEDRHWDNLKNLGY